MLLAYLPGLLAGALTTLAVAGGALVLAVVLGLGGALARLSRRPVLRAVATAYATVVRGVPDLVLMLLLFYGGQRLVNAALARWADGAYVDVDPFVAGTLTIGFVYGAYLGETFRGAFLAVPAGQVEAARACGMSERQVFTRVLGPLMLRHALPALSNNWLVMLKSTAIVSVIGLPDLMQRAGLAAGATHQPFVFYAAAAAIYLVVTALSEAGLRLLESRLQAGVREAAR
jgi:His/Glu/Gln/Arg/opine family amino acid ABC transporter permease subunit